MPNKYMTIAGHSEGLIAKTCWKKAEEAIEKAAQSQDPVNRAILFYGGDSPENNHSHYYKNLKDMIKSLEGKVDPFEAISKLIKIIKVPSLRSARGSVFTCYHAGSRFKLPFAALCEWHFCYLSNDF